MDRVGSEDIDKIRIMVLLFDYVEYHVGDIYRNRIEFYNDILLNDVICLHHYSIHHLLENLNLYYNHTLYSNPQIDTIIKTNHLHFTSSFKPEIITRFNSSMKY